MSEIDVGKEFIDGHKFNYIDKEGKSAYSRLHEVVLKVDQNAWILCWELVRKRPKKEKCYRSFVFMDSIVDVRINIVNGHEMIVVCNRDYITPKFFSFISDQQHTVHKWATYLFYLAHRLRKQGETSIFTVNKLLITQRLDMEKKVKNEIMYECWNCTYESMVEKLHKFDKKNLGGPNEELIDIYLRFASRPDLEEIFNQISNGQPKINVEQFMDFISSTQCDQKMKISKQQTFDLIQLLDPGQKGLSIRGFIKFMIGPLNDKYGSRYKNETFKADKPLSQYYIKSSHNSYLNGTQIKFVKQLPNIKHNQCMADVEMYRQILLSGCRCIEFDCWDGPLGEPIITHGPVALQRINTITLRSVCEAVIETAFKTSSYPVVISLENHCNPDQQQAIVQIFTAIFGKYLLAGPLFDYPLDEKSELPPPEALRYKILIKGTRRKSQKESEQQPKISFKNPISFLNQMEQSRVEAKQQKIELREKRKNLKYQKEAGFIAEESPNITTTGIFKRMEGLMSGKTASSSDSSLSNFPTDDELDTESILTVEMTSSLADIINYFQSSHDLNFDDPCYMMHSGSEHKIDKSITMYPNRFLQHSAQHIIRVYPAAWRVDSSNFNPMQYLMAGCQLVSMNFQTNGLIMQLYDSFFEDETNSGYILKPQLLIKNIYTLRDKQFYAHRLEIQILSAQFLHLITSRCKNRKLTKVTVKLDLYDLPHNSYTNKNEIVSISTGDGFNTIFEKKCVVFDKMITLELTMLHIRILDEHGSKIGQRFLRVDQIMSGYRHIQIRNRQNRAEPAFLFGKFRLERYLPDGQAEIRDIYSNPLRDRLASEDARKQFESRLRAWERQKKWTDDSKKSIGSSKESNVSSFYSVDSKSSSTNMSTGTPSSNSLSNISRLSNNISHSTISSPSLERPSVTNSASMRSNVTDSSSTSTDYATFGDNKNSFERL